MWSDCLGVKATQGGTQLHACCTLPPTKNTISNKGSVDPLQSIDKAALETEHRGLQGFQPSSAAAGALHRTTCAAADISHCVPVVLSCVRLCTGCAKQAVCTKAHLSRQALTCKAARPPQASAGQTYAVTAAPSCSRSRLPAAPCQHQLPALIPPGCPIPCCCCCCHC